MKLLIAAAVSALSLAAQSAAPATKLTAEQILDKYVEATGGKEAYSKLKSSQMTGTIELVGRGLKAPVTLYKIQGASYMSMDMPGVGKIESGVANGVAWERSQVTGARLKNGDELALALRESDMDVRASWRKHYKAAILDGEETVNGRPAWKLTLVPNTGKNEAWLFDKETYYLVKFTAVVKSPMGEVPAESTMEDYKESGKIMTPRLMVQKLLGIEMRTTFDSVNFNLEVPGRMFELPADVKALVDKQGAPAPAAK